MNSVIIGLLAATVTATSHDGVNTITAELDGDGNVAAVSSTTLHASPKVTVFRLELEAEGESETPYLVGEDGVRRRVCIIAPDEYALLTNQVVSVWKALHKTDDGRRKIHGKRVREVINTNALVKTTVYADGYTFDEQLVRNTREVRRKFAESTPPSKRSPVASGVPYSDGTRKALGIKNVSERHRKMIEEREKHRNAKPKTVTIEHDATTGKDTVK